MLDIQDYFPLHRQQERGALSHKWKTRYWWCANPWLQPITHIRAYFGEKVALYFAFGSFYTKWLLAPGFIGVVVYVRGGALRACVCVHNPSQQ